MKICSYFLPAILFFSFSAYSVAAAPNIGTDAIVNAASSLPSGFPNSGIAQGAIFSIYGTDLGPSSSPPLSFPLQNTLGGVSVNVTVNGTSVGALPLYVGTGQINAILPSTTPVGKGTLIVSYNGQTSNAAPIQVVASSFAAFTASQTGSGPAIVTTPQFNLVTLTSSAKPGDILILWGTGLGPVSGNEAAGPLPGDLTNLNVSVYVGGKPSNVTYRGRSGCCAGLDQIVFQIPDGVSGCYVPLAVRVGNVISNFPSLSVSANGGICSDPIGLPSQAIQQVVNGQPLKVGLVVLSRISPQFTLGPVSFKVNQDLAAASFYSFNSSSLLFSAGFTAVNAFGSCTVFDCRGSLCIPQQQALSVSGLDAGPSLTLTRLQDSQTAQVPEVSTGVYRAMVGGGGVPGLITGPPDYLNPGDFTVAAPGAPGGIGAFNTKVTVSSSLQWTNQSTVTDVPRAQDLTIEWSGGDPNGYVTIVGASTSDSPQVTATFACIANAGLGRFTVPSWVLSAMPASGTLAEGGINFANGFLLVGTYPPLAPFSAPGLDFGFASAVYLQGKNVPYR